MFEDLKNITVTHSEGLELIVYNPTGYKLISKGAHGAVFRLDENKCVKIYADRINAELEAKSYKAAQVTGLVPMLFESGNNYNIIEYIEGPTLYDRLRNECSINIDLTLKIIQALETMKAAGFTRIDAALWHFLIDKHNNLRLIDIVYSMTRFDKEPIKILTGMRSLGLLNDFLANVRLIDEKKFKEWEKIVSTD